jgi:hypothetical protein
MQTIVKLSELKNNPKRDFRIDPLDEKRIEELQASIAKEGLKSLPGTIELKRLVEPGSKRLSCISIRT